MRDRMRSLIESAKVLTITHEDPRLTIRDAEENERALFTDGRDIEFELASDLWTARAKWKKGRKIVLKAKSARGRKIRETIEFSGDGTKLLIGVKMDAGERMPSFEFQRVYDPFPVDPDEVSFAPDRTSRLKRKTAGLGGGLRPAASGGRYFARLGIRD